MLCLPSRAENKVCGDIEFLFEAGFVTTPARIDNSTYGGISVAKLDNAGKFILKKTERSAWCSDCLEAETTIEFSSSRVGTSSVQIATVELAPWFLFRVTMMALDLSIYDNDSTVITPCSVSESGTMIDAVGCSTSPITITEELDFERRRNNHRVRRRQEESFIEHAAVGKLGLIAVLLAPVLLYWLGELTRYNAVWSPSPSSPTVTSSACRVEQVMRERARARKRLTLLSVCRCPHRIRSRIRWNTPSRLATGGVFAVLGDCVLAHRMLAMLRVRLRARDDAHTNRLGVRVVDVRRALLAGLRRVRRPEQLWRRDRRAVVPCLRRLHEPGGGK